MVKFLIFITWLQGGCVYAHTCAWGHSLQNMHFLLSFCGQKYCVPNSPLHYINDMKKPEFVKGKKYLSLEPGKEKVEWMPAPRTEGHLMVASLVSVLPRSLSPKTLVSIRDHCGSEEGDPTLVPGVVQTHQWS